MRRRRARFAPSSPSSARSKAQRWPGGFAPGWRGSPSYQRDSRSADPATRANAERLKPSDPIVEQFALLNVERRERLLQFLADARHRHEAGLARAPGSAPGAAQASSSNANAESPSAVAARGVAGAGGALPHASAIQARFGKHDISPIRAHVGGAAAEASAALGAEAYATGDAVGFAHAPDLHTAAHEAAHVVQQRAGVQLKGSVDGGGGDPHEQHADAVADAVVRGESAESLLDVAPRGATTGAAQRPAVQRKTGGQASKGPAKRHERIALYVVANENPIRRAIYSGLRAVGWPDPAPRLTLQNADAFTDVLAATLRDGAELATYEQVAGLLYPDDPEALLGPLVPPTDAWVPTVGMAFVHALERGVTASLHRLGPRYLSAADARGIVGDGTLDYSALAPSMPIDRWVGRAMTYERMLSIEPPDAADARRARGKATGLRKVQLVAEGGHDRNLWQYVRAVSPADATPEEVAATLWQGQGESGSYYAYRLAAAPPLFGLPDGWARKNELTKAYAPPERGDANAVDDRPEVRVLAVAGSDVADELALQQAAVSRAAGPAAQHPPAAAQVVQAFGDCQLQLEFVTQALAPWELVAPLIPAQAFVVRTILKLGSVEPAGLPTWAEVAAGQFQRLYRISGAIRKLIVAAPKAGITNPQSDEAAPIRSILELFASAAGTSHLPNACEPLLQRALDRQAALEVEAVQGVARDLDRATSGYVQQGDDTAGARALHSEALAAQDTLDQIQTRMVTGASVAAGEVDEATLHAEEIAIHERVIGTQDWTNRLGMAAIHAKEGIAAHAAALFSGRFRDMPAMAAYILEQVGNAYTAWVAANNALAARLKKEPDSPGRTAQQRAGRRANLSVLQNAFKRLSADPDIATFLREGSNVIENQEFRTACVQTAVMIGISLVAAGAGGMVAEAASESFMAAEGVGTVAELSTTARVAAAGEGMLAEAGVNAAGQKLTSGGDESLGAAFAENLLISLGMSAIGVVGKLGEDADLAGAVERRSAGMWTKIGGGLKWSAVITAHTITGAALGYVAHRIVTHKAQVMPSTLREWLLQGASIAVGRYVHKAMGARMPGLERLANHPEFPEGRRLLTEGRNIEQHAEQLENSKNSDAASELLTQQSTLVDEAISEIEKLSAAHGDPGGELAKMEAGFSAQRAELHSESMLGTRLQLAGMTELVPGELWRGDRGQIDQFLARARKSDPHLEAIHDTASGRWRIRVDGHELQLQEVAQLRETSTEHGEHHDIERSSAGDSTQAPVTAGHEAPDQPRRPAASISKLDGRKVAAQVPGATYEVGGTFRISTEHGELELSIRRTTGAARVIRDGEHAVIEIPRGLTGTDLEGAIVEQLRSAATELEQTGSEQIKRRPHPGDDHEYQYDAMHPGPLSDESVYGDPKRTGNPMPAQGFYAGKYDVDVLPGDTVFYRVGDGDRAWGQWWTDTPLDSEAQYRIDVAVKRVWTDPATGEVPAGSTRGGKQLELWSYAAVFPKGTTVYEGPVGSQGGVHMGGPSTKQYFIPQAWKLEGKGASIVSKQPFNRHGPNSAPASTPQEAAGGKVK